MKADLLGKWIDALEGGDYAQTTGALRKEDPDGKVGYCCLGVLKEITGCTWKKASTQEGGGKFDLTDVEQSEAGTLVFFNEDDDDPQVSRLPDSLLTYPTDGDLEEWGMEWETARQLAEQNDEGDSFQGIAQTLRIKFDTVTDDEQTQAA